MTEINRDLCHFLIYVAPPGECMSMTGKAALQGHFFIPFKVKHYLGTCQNFHRSYGLNMSHRCFLRDEKVCWYGGCWSQVSHKSKDCQEACEQECQELTSSCYTPNLCCRSMKTQKHQDLITTRSIPRLGFPPWPMTNGQPQPKSTHPVQ